jgi:hypothetical protein
VDEVIEYFNESKEKVLIVGYDWGGAIGINYCLNRN